MKAKEAPKNLRNAAEKPLKMMLKKQKRNSSPQQFRDSIKYLKKEEWQALKESIDNFRDKTIINLLIFLRSKGSGTFFHENRRP